MSLILLDLLKTHATLTKKWHNRQILWIEKILRATFRQLQLVSGLPSPDVPTPDTLAWKESVESAEGAASTGITSKIIYASLNCYLRFVDNLEFGDSALGKSLLNLLARLNNGDVSLGQISQLPGMNSLFLMSICVLTRMQHTNGVKMTKGHDRTLSTLGVRLMQRVLNFIENESATVLEYRHTLEQNQVTRSREERVIIGRTGLVALEGVSNALIARLGRF
jgi:hypothetical protein